MKSERRRGKRQSVRKRGREEVQVEKQMKKLS